MFPHFDDDDDFPRSHRGPGDSSGPHSSRGPHGHGGPGGPGGPFGGDWMGSGFDPRAFAMMFRKMAGGGRGRGPRRGRGDIRLAVLALLREEPMHGYQIIRELDERSSGEWKPSAGSVYPTLQMLADEGLIVANETDGKKVYSLTSDGQTEADSHSEETAPWESSESTATPLKDLPLAGAKLAQAVSQVMHSRNDELIRDATEVINDARRRIYELLARD